MYGSAIGAEAPREMSPVERATDALRQAGFRQQDLLGALHERLSKVMTPPAPQEVAKCGELRAAPGCVMEEWLEQEAARIQQANAALSDILGRLRI